MAAAATTATTTSSFLLRRCSSQLRLIGGIVGATATRSSSSYSSTASSSSERRRSVLEYCSPVQVFEYDHQNDNRQKDDTDEYDSRYAREFYRRFYFSNTRRSRSRRHPVVLRNLVAHSSAVERWHDLDYLRRRVVAAVAAVGAEDNSSGSGTVVHCDVETNGGAYNNSNNKNHDDTTTTTRMTIPFEQYLDYLQLYEELYPADDGNTNTNNNASSNPPRPPPKDQLLYMAQNELGNFGPYLRRDIEIPEICTTAASSSNDESGSSDSNSSSHSKTLGRVYQTMLWLGPKGCVSPLHYDPLDNLLMQVVGRKRVVLANPEHPYLDSDDNSNDSNNDWLYAGEKYGQQYNTSAIVDLDCDGEDGDAVFERYPEFARVVFEHRRAEREKSDAVPSSQSQSQWQSPLLVAELNPGDALFIPSKWWHHVRSLDRSASVNVWWR